LPVLRNGRLIGIFTTRDAIGVLAGPRKAAGNVKLGEAASAGEGKSHA